MPKMAQGDSQQPSQDPSNSQKGRFHQDESSDHECASLAGADVVGCRFISHQGFGRDGPMDEKEGWACLL